jgi:hypothetical protein
MWVLFNTMGNIVLVQLLEVIVKFLGGIVLLELIKNESFNVI